MEALGRACHILYERKLVRETNGLHQEFSFARRVHKVLLMWIIEYFYSHFFRLKREKNSFVILLIRRKRLESEAFENFHDEKMA